MAEVAEVDVGQMEEMVGLVAVEEVEDMVVQEVEAVEVMVHIQVIRMEAVEAVEVMVLVQHGVLMLDMLEEVMEGCMAYITAMAVMVFV